MSNAEHDAAERVERAEQALRESEERYRSIFEQNIHERQRTVRFSEAFVGILGHDLRNPLSAISTAAGLLSRRAQEVERIAKPVDRILTSVDRMDRMISQLLDFTRIRLGRGIPLDRARVDLTEITRLVVEGVEQACSREVLLEVAGDTSGSWDADRLSQLASNLVANACQHGTQDTPVGIRLDGSGPDVVRLEVRNQGVIPQDLLPVVFEPLCDARDGAQKRVASSGLGLGLYITQQIAFAHGGTIRVESDPRGTSFIVALPRHAAAESESSRSV
jgi:signal transduction histidine kinase